MAGVNDNTGTRKGGPSLPSYQPYNPSREAYTAGDYLESTANGKESYSIRLKSDPALSWFSGSSSSINLMNIGPVELGGLSRMSLL